MVTMVQKRVRQNCKVVPKPMPTRFLKLTGAALKK